MATAYSDTYVNFIGIPDAGVAATDIEQFKVIKMYERRTHHDDDKRRVPVVIDIPDIELARCRGSAIAESVNRFGKADVKDVTQGVREVHEHIDQ